MIHDSEVNKLGEANGLAPATNHQRSPETFSFDLRSVYYHAYLKATGLMPNSARPTCHGLESSSPTWPLPRSHHKLHQTLQQQSVSRDFHAFCHLCPPEVPAATELGKLDKQAPSWLEPEMHRSDQPVVLWPSPLLVLLV